MAKPIDVLARGMHLEHILRRLGPEFRMIELIAAIFGKFESDVGSPANESWNVETAKRLAVVLRSLECEQLDSRSAPDDNGHRTTTSRWGNPFAES